MNYFFLSVIASIFVILGYMLEFYSIITYKKKDVDSIYIWLIWTSGNTFSVAYCVLIHEYYIMATNVIILIMNFSVFMLKYYYLYIYEAKCITDEESIVEEKSIVDEKSIVEISNV